MHDDLTSMAIHRAAISEWRDAATMSAITLLHDAAVDTMRVVDTQLEKTAVADAAFNHSALARDAVESAMRGRVNNVMKDWLTHQALALRAIDPRLIPVAQNFGKADDHLLQRQEEVPPASASRFATPAWVSSSVETLGMAISQAATTVVGRAIPNLVRESASQLVSHATREFAERSGIRDWVRSAGRDELTRAWLGTAAVEDPERPPAYLTQLFERIDRTAIAARAAVA